MPSSFEAVKTDNRTLRMATDSGNIFCAECLLEPKPELLGITDAFKHEVKAIRNGCFYVIHAMGTNLFKIGITSSIVRRFRDLSAASPLPLQIAFYGECHEPRDVEVYFHNIFKKQHFKNEWFALSSGDLSMIVDFMARHYE